MAKQQKNLKLKAGQVVVASTRDRFGDFSIKTVYIVASDYLGPQRHASDLEADGVLLRKSGHLEFQANLEAEVFWSQLK